ncbi:hypothetical protein ACSBR2_041586 [Camellia fascicularis]
MSPSHLKINKDSHFIKKSPSPPSSFSSSASSLATAVVAATTKPQHRHPVIIYTHSPKIIHTNPRDFMALVQKLTGLSRSDDDPPPRPKQDPGSGAAAAFKRENHHKVSVTANDDNESSSAITDDNCTSNLQINSCFGTQSTTTATTRTNFEPPNPCFNNIPLFTPNSSDFLCPSQPFYNNYADSLILIPNMRSAISPTSTLDAMKEFREF